MAREEGCCKGRGESRRGEVYRRERPNFLIEVPSKGEGGEGGGKGVDSVIEVVSKDEVSERGREGSDGLIEAPPEGHVRHTRWYVLYQAHVKKNHLYLTTSSPPHNLLTTTSPPSHCLLTTTSPPSPPPHHLLTTSLPPGYW